MNAVERVSGIAAPLDRSNIDTDQIVPKDFLKRIERHGFGEFLFHGWRWSVDGAPNPDFVLNDPRYRGAAVLVTGENFGCGSSREHAAWAISDYGFAAVVAPSFADIFLSNCFEVGLVPVELEARAVRHVMDRALDQPGYRLDIDVRQGRVSGSDGFEAAFHLDPFRRDALILGLDSIGRTLRFDEEIRRYEASRSPWK